MMKKVLFICFIIFAVFAIPSFAEAHGIAESVTATAEDFPSKADLFVERDPSGLVLTITAMAVVLTILFTLFIFFTLLGKVMKNLTAGKKKKTQPASVVSGKSSKKPAGDLSNGETIAAIAMALEMYQNDIHDNESTVLTINKVARVYSPWNSKIYNMRPFPYKK